MNSIFGQVLYAQWKSGRAVLLPLLVICVGLPVSAVVGAQRMADRWVGVSGSIDATDLLASFQTWGVAFPLLAVMCGVFAGITAWNWDHRTNHVYALSLPISRTRYALQKMAAGALPVLACAAMVLAGGLMVAAFITLPRGVHAYPVDMTVRFLMTGLLIYGLVFSLAAGSVRTLVIVMLAIMVVLVFGGVVTDALQDIFGLSALRTPGDWLYDAMTSWPGPFSVFGGNWMLIDV